MKKAYLVHGWGGNPDNCWFPWLREELKQREIGAESIAMPTPDTPDPVAWPQALAKAVPNPDADTVLVGHSIGCQTIMRYLAGLPEELKVAGVVLVAPFVQLHRQEVQGDEEIRLNWDRQPLDFESFKAKAGRMTCIFSNDDPDVDLNTNMPFFKSLGCEIVIESGKGHFSDDAGVTELPSALDAVLKSYK